MDQPAPDTRFRKLQIARETLERYTGSAPDLFQPYVLLTNFQLYTERFAVGERRSSHRGSAMSAVHDPSAGISLVCFGIGSPNAALIVDVLSSIQPRAILFLGLCGGLSEKHRVGDFFLPTAAIRDDGTSHHYLPERVPALPYFLIQRYLSLELDRRSLTCRHGIIHTTGYRFWEFDQSFREMLLAERARAIDMETAAVFAVGFALGLRVGALLLISDLPLTEEGIKTRRSSRAVFDKFMDIHLDVGLSSLLQMKKESG